MSVTISNYSLKSRPGGRVQVSGNVSSTTNDFAVVRLTGSYVEQVCLADPTTGYFCADVFVNPWLTTAIAAVATNGDGTSSQSSASVVAPTVSGTLGKTVVHNGDNTWTVTLAYSVTWTVDLDVQHRGVFSSMLPEINGVQALEVNADGVAGFSYVFTLPSSYSTLTGQQVAFVVRDSWGFLHTVAVVL